MDKHAEARHYLSERVGYQVPQEAAERFLADQCANRPGLVHQLKGWMAQNVERGQLVRVRWAIRYSTVYVLYDALGAPPAAVSADLYAIPTANVDPVYGAMDESQTNQLQAARMDSDQQFVATHHGFSVFVIKPPDLVAANPGVMTDLAIQWGIIPATFKLGTETDQVWGPINQIAYPIPVPFGATDHAAANFAPSQVTATPPQGYQALHRLRPNQVLGAGQSFRVRLQVVPGLLPTNILYTNAVVAIRHLFYGRTRTAITG